MWLVQSIVSWRKSQDSKATRSAIAPSWSTWTYHRFISMSGIPWREHRPDSAQFLSGFIFRPKNYALRRNGASHPVPRLALLYKQNNQQGGKNMDKTINREHVKPGGSYRSFSFSPHCQPTTNRSEGLNVSRASDSDVLSPAPVFPTNSYREPALCHPTIMKSQIF